MAVTQTTANKMSRQEWLQKRKEIAQIQLRHIPDLIQSFFRAGDATSFLQLLSRLPSYSFQNLLIIFEKQPKATILAGFPVWQQLLGGNGTQQVLKPEGVGAGIDILLPFTNMIGEKDFELTWYSVPVFDIRQTNVRSIKQRDPVYVQDAMHRLFLHQAVRSAIRTGYHRGIVYETDHKALLASSTHGRITANSVTVSRSAKEEDALFWLSEALCTLAAEETPLSTPCRALLSQYSHFCLYSMWGLSHPGILPRSHQMIPEAEQTAFLDLLQRTVFTLHQKVGGFYLSGRQEEALLQDDFETGL